jgi:hypothetical protein
MNRADRKEGFCKRESGRVAHECERCPGTNRGERSQRGQMQDKVPNGAGSYDQKPHLLFGVSGQPDTPFDMGHWTTQHWTVKEGESLESSIQEIPLP